MPPAARGKAVRNPFVTRHPFSEEDLSAYLDSRLSTAESARLEEHVLSCDSCRQQLDGLRAVVKGLRALPTVSAPRSFALRPERVQAPSRPVAWAFGPAGAAVASFLLLLTLVGVDLGTLGGGGASEEAVQMAAENTFEGGAQSVGALPAPSPMLGIAPEATPAPDIAEPAPAAEAAPTPAPAARAAADEEKEAGSPEAAVDADTAAEAPAREERAPNADEGDDTGRWVLRGFEGAAGAVLLVALAAVVWRRRRERAGSRT